MGAVSGKKGERKMKRLSRKVGTMVCVMIIFAVAVSVGICVYLFYGLVTKNMEESCVSGTKILADRLKEASYDEDFTALLDELKEETGCEFTIFEGNVRKYTTIEENGKRAVGTTLSDELTKTVIGQGKSYVGKAYIFGKIHLCSYEPTRDENGAVNGLIFAGISIDTILKNVNRVILLSILVSLGLILADVVWLLRFMKRTVSRPLGKLTELAQTMEEGRLSDSTKLEGGRHGNDEIGYLAEVMEHTMSELQNYIGEISMVLKEVAQGNLTAETKQEYVGDFVSIQHSLDDILHNLNNTMSQISMSAMQVSGSADHLSSGAQSLSQ